MSCWQTLNPHQKNWYNCINHKKVNTGKTKDHTGVGRNKKTLVNEEREIQIHGVNQNGRKL